MLSESELRLFQNGDEAFLTTCYRHHTPELCKRLRNRGLPSDEIDDVIQETWARVLTHSAKFANRGPLEAWLWAICRDIYVHSARKERRRRVIAALAADDIKERLTHAPDTEVIEFGLLRQEIDDWVDDAIMALAPLERNVAVYRWLLGKTTACTASSLRIAPGTVKAALHRARSKLRIRFQTVANPPRVRHRTTVPVNTSTGNVTHPPSPPGRSSPHPAPGPSRAPWSPGGPRSGAAPPQRRRRRAGCAW